MPFERTQFRDAGTEIVVQLIDAFQLLEKFERCGHVQRPHPYEANFIA
jgi:hypothetical protein